ncbi:MAG TPA: SRPBCC family protein [Steroidobacteraceae bacterium]|jgi:hypothetical protein
MTATKIVSLGVLLAATAPVPADVLNVAAGGFQVHEAVHVKVSPEQAYDLLLRPSRWWSSEHTFSRNADNLTLDPHAGGCWCETLPDGGSVEHMRILWVSPGKALRLRGGLGPFQAMAVDGVLSFAIKASPDGSEVTLDYSLGGYSKDGFDALAKITDKVMNEQLERLKKALEP